MDEPFDELRNIANENGVIIAVGPLVPELEEGLPKVKETAWSYLLKLELKVV